MPYPTDGLVYPEPLSGEQTGRHFTVAVFVVWEGKVLLHFHRKLGMWLPPGGHIELCPRGCPSTLTENPRGLALGNSDGMQRAGDVRLRPVVGDVATFRNRRRVG